MCVRKSQHKVDYKWQGDKGHCILYHQLFHQNTEKVIKHFSPFSKNFHTSQTRQPANHRTYMDQQMIDSTMRKYLKS